jgi:hypothetical protein
MASVHQKQPLAKVAVSVLIEGVAVCMVGLFFLADIGWLQEGSMPIIQQISGNKCPAGGSNFFCIMSVNKKKDIRFTLVVWVFGFMRCFDLFYPLNLLL